MELLAGPRREPRFPDPRDARHNEHSRAVVSSGRTQLFPAAHKRLDRGGFRLHLDKRGGSRRNKGWEVHNTRDPHRAEDCEQARTSANGFERLAHARFPDSRWVLDTDGFRQRAVTDANRLDASRGRQLVGFAALSDASDVRSLFPDQAITDQGSNRLREMSEPDPHGFGDPLLRQPSGRFGGLQHLADRKSTRLNSSHLVISYAVFCLKKKKRKKKHTTTRKDTTD